MSEDLKALGRNVIIEMDPYDPVPMEEVTAAGIIISNGNSEERNKKKTQAAFAATVGTVVSIGDKVESELVVGDRVQPRPGAYFRCFDEPVYQDCTLNPMDPINRRLIVIDYENILVKLN